MKLLEKQQINANIQSEKKKQIDSGIFLATKVDKLREELNNLEKQRADFIEGSRVELQNAVGDLKIEKGNLIFEVKEATKHLALLREPLDDEWKEVREQKLLLKEVKINYETGLKSLEEEKQTLEEEKSLVENLKITSIENEKQTYELLEKVSEDKEDTKRFLSEARDLKETKETELYNREISLTEKEKLIKLREEALEKEKLELNKEIKLLAIKKQRIK